MRNEGADREWLPTPDQLVDDLRKVVRRGVGKPLASEEAIPNLWAVALELADDEEVASPMLVAEVVVPIVRSLEPQEYREAAATILWVNLDDPSGIYREKPPPLEGADYRYDKVGQLLSRSERDVKNELVKSLLADVARLIVARLKKHRGEPVQPDTQDSQAAESTAPSPEVQVHARSNTRPISAVGIALMLLGVLWLVGVALGAFN
jgi:hypothetical protein